MGNKFIKIISSAIVIFFIIIMISLFVYSAKLSNNEEDINERIIEEIKYMDDKIFRLANILNNVAIENDYVNVKNKNQKIGIQDNTITEEVIKVNNGQRTNNIENNQEENTNSEESKIQKEIQSLYTTWNSTILDLYKINADSNSILDVSANIDKLSESNKNQNKVETIETLCNIYEHIPEFAKIDSQNEEIVKILDVKLSILKAYANVEKDDWNAVAEEIKNAESKYLTILNSIPKNENSIYNINKGYIVLEELKLGINMKSKEVFLEKYKNLIKEINFIE